MVVTTVPKPGDFVTTFSVTNTSTPDRIQYGVMPGGKIYRERMRRDSTAPTIGGRGTWVDTGLTIPDISAPNDL